jgi:FAD/FMN-containing dehydrogenase
MERIRPDDARYDDARTIHNAMIDRRPAVIAVCTSPEDVVTALAEARRDGFEVAVRAGGHSVAGACLNDGGTVIDVRSMNGVEVDRDTRRARVGAGATWAELDRATQAHGLATTGGRVSTTGVAGLTLGGGSGWLERSYGLACDNLASVDLVTADGSRVTTSASQHPELFWALHGGGGNFGIVTSLEFDLHPVGPEVYAGLMLWDADDADDVARAFRDLVADAPDALGPGLIMFPGPPEEFVPVHLHGRPVVAVAGMWADDPAEGQAAFAPFRELDPEVDLFGLMPYVEFQSMIDDAPGNRNYWTADHHDTFPDKALDVFVQHGRNPASELDQLLLVPWGGAIARLDAADTPLALRGSGWVTHPFAVWEDAEDDEANIAWARGFRRDIAPFANGGVYLNFIGSEGEDRVRAAFGERNYTRLQQVKAEFDPDNVLHGNQNIRPAT